MQRSESQERRQQLVEHVMDGLRHGTYAPGATLPSLRDLGDRFGLSRGTAQDALGPLLSSGVLVAVSRSGILVADRSDADLGCFLLVVRRRDLEGTAGHGSEIRRGFERSISRLGAVSLLWLAEDDPVPQVDLAGVFVFNTEAPARISRLAVPTVGFIEPLRGQGSGDLVRLDDFGGGRDATNHLLVRGLRRIAFLARHPADERSLGAWAEERERGWRHALGRHPGAGTPLVFRACAEDLDAPDCDGRMVAHAVARRAISRRDEFDSLVGVDDWSVGALLQEWQSAGLAADAVPPMVGFEDLPEARNPMVTSVRPPWDRVGETAGELLWQRAVGQVVGPPVRRDVPMDMATRLSSQRSWRLPAAFD